MFLAGLRIELSDNIQKGIMVSSGEMVTPNYLYFINSPKLFVISFCVTTFVNSPGNFAYKYEDSNGTMIEKSE